MESPDDKTIHLLMNVTGVPSVIMLAASWDESGYSRLQISFMAVFFSDSCESESTKERKNKISGCVNGPISLTDEGVMYEASQRDAAVPRAMCALCQMEDEKQMYSNKVLNLWSARSLPFLLCKCEYNNLFWVCDFLLFFSWLTRFI